MNYKETPKNFLEKLPIYHHPETNEEVKDNEEIFKIYISKLLVELNMSFDKINETMKEEVRKMLSNKSGQFSESFSKKFMIYLISICAKHNEFYSNEEIENKKKYQKKPNTAFKKNPNLAKSLRGEQKILSKTKSE